MKKRVRNRARRTPKHMKVDIGGVLVDVTVQHSWSDKEGNRWAVFSVARQPHLNVESDA